MPDTGSIARDLKNLNWQTMSLFMETPPGSLLSLDPRFYPRVIGYLVALRPGEVLRMDGRVYRAERRPWWAFWRKQRIAHWKYVGVSTLAERIAARSAAGITEGGTDANS